jgi:hypothetical protein
MKTKQKVSFAGLGAVILMAFSSFFIACPSAIDDLTDVNDKIGNISTVLPDVGALDVVNKTALKNISEVKIETLDGQPVRLIRGDISSALPNNHVPAFLGKGGYRVTLTLSDSSIISEDVEIELDKVTTLYFDVVGGVNTITQDTGTAASPSSTRGAVKITNTSPPNMATITHVKIQDMTLNTESVSTTAIVGSGPSWVCPLNAGDYVVSVSTDGTSYTGGTFITLVAGGIIELRYLNGSLISAADVSSETGTLRVKNVSLPGAHTITNVRIKNRNTGEFTDFNESINGGRAWSTAQPVGVYKVYISENGGASYPAGTEIEATVYQGITTEISYCDGLPDTGALVELSPEIKTGGLRIKNERTMPGNIIAMKLWASDGTEYYHPASSFPLYGGGPSSASHDYPIGPYSVYISTDVTPVLTYTASLTIQADMTQTLVCRDAMMDTYVTSEPDEGWITVKLTPGPDGKPVQYPDYELIAISLTNLALPYPPPPAIDILAHIPASLSVRLTKSQMSMPDAIKIPVGAYTAVITSTTSYMGPLTTTPVNSTAEHKHTSIVRIHKGMLTELSYSFLNNYWDSVYDSSPTLALPGKLTVYNSLAGKAYFTNLEVWKTPPPPVPAGRLCYESSAINGAIRAIDWTGVVATGNKVTLELAPGMYWVRAKGTGHSNWIGGPQGYWRTVTVASQKNAVLYFETNNLRPLE